MPYKLQQLDIGDPRSRVQFLMAPLRQQLRDHWSLLLAIPFSIAFLCIVQRDTDLWPRTRPKRCRHDEKSILRPARTKSQTWLNTRRSWGTSGYFFSRGNKLHVKVAIVIDWHIYFQLRLSKGLANANMDKSTSLLIFKSKREKLWP